MQTKKPNFPEHSHDFSEVIYIVEGRMRHLINGRAQVLNPGDLVLIRPWDVHECKTYDRKGVVSVNISLRQDIIDNLRQRYFARDIHFWGGRAKKPLTFSLAHTQRRWFESAAEPLTKMPRNLFKIERFLMNVIDELAHHYTLAGLSGCPVWLRDACRLIYEPQHFSRGAAELFRLAGRSKSYVDRKLKEHTGKTAIKVVNDARVDYACSQLVMTSKKVGEIARECGFKRPAQLHRLFLKRLGVTPLKYRSQDHIAGRA